MTANSSLATKMMAMQHTTLQTRPFHMAFSCLQLQEASHASMHCYQHHSIDLSNIHVHHHPLNTHMPHQEQH